MCISSICSADKKRRSNDVNPYEEPFVPANGGTAPSGTRVSSKPSAYSSFNEYTFHPFLFTTPSAPPSPVKEGAGAQGTQAPPPVKSPSASDVRRSLLGAASPLVGLATAFGGNAAAQTAPLSQAASQQQAKARSRSPANTLENSGTGASDFVPFEHLFCVALETAARTYFDMRAGATDLQKVSNCSINDFQNLHSSNSLLYLLLRHRFSQWFANRSFSCLLKLHRVSTNSSTS